MIETQRLILKPVTSSDFELFQEIMSCPEMTKYLPKGAPYTEQEVLAHVTKRVTHWEQGFGLYVVYSKEDLTTKLGYAGVENSPNPNCSDIRYGFRPIAQGKGYAFEAAKAALNITFGLGKHTHIYGVAVKDNIPSINILKKLGMSEDSSVVIYDEECLVTLSVAKSA